MHLTDRQAEPRFYKESAKKHKNIGLHTSNINPLHHNEKVVRQLSPPAKFTSNKKKMGGNFNIFSC